MPYPTIRHKEAYELWRAGWSIKRISSQKNMPDRRELRNWMAPDYACSCGYHGWISLRMQEIKVTRGTTELNPEETASIRELEEELRGAAEQLTPSLIKALSEAVGAPVTKDLTGDLQSDMISTAYMILARVREVLPDIQIKDAFALRQILGVAVQMLVAFRPAGEVQRDEVAKINVALPEYPRGLENLESADL